MFVYELNKSTQQFWHGLYAFGMVPMPLAWSPCLWHGPHTFGTVPMPLAQSPCLWHSAHASSIVTMPSAWSPCFLYGFYASRATPLLLLTFFAFLAFFCIFLRFWHYLQLCLWNFAMAKLVTQRILRTVLNRADMCWLPLQLIAGKRSFCSKIDLTFPKLLT